MKTIDNATVEIMFRLISAQWVCKPIYIVTKLGIPDLISGREMAIEEIATVTKTLKSRLYRIMRALASVGIFSETEEKRFSSTPMSECLKEKIMGPVALMFLAPWHNRAWDELSDSLKNGEVPFEKAHGMPAFQWLSGHPVELEVFNRATAVNSGSDHKNIIDHYDFTRIKTVADIGGGQGVLMSALLNAFPRLSGCIAEIPGTLKKAEALFEGYGLSHRCHFEECDFFKKVPAGYNRYILSNILHDWNDNACLKILKNCRDAMSLDSALLVVEMLIAGGSGPSVAKLLDLEVLVMGDGQERSEEEFQRLFEKAGFKLGRIIPLKGELVLMECHPQKDI